MQEVARPQAQGPALVIDPMLRRRLDLYIQHCDTEISGLGIVVPEDGNLRITELFLLDQVVTGTTTDLNPEAVAKLMCDIIEKGLPVGGLKLWWHSHCNMSVFWSGTDHETIRTLGDNWAVSLVGNKKGEYLARVDVYAPIRLAVDNLPFVTKTTEDDALVQEVKAEIALKTKKPEVHRYVGEGHDWEEMMAYLVPPTRSTGLQPREGRHVWGKRADGTHGWKGVAVAPTSEAVPTNGSDVLSKDVTPSDLAEQEAQRLRPKQHPVGLA